ncbi:UDP-glucuronic acid decarboxylase 1 [Hibiscus syriacus]|uniref:UDP-glucuronic acid decarboxylase 1 n=1 Tax=Hibiscus syriacus TaxID=106335 RepID=A0A6A2ZZI7_HIBSY|nr:UDP-glucuronic acid decarboxylase 1 [Hibiscus syriacus]
MCMDDGRVVSNFVAQALRKEPLTVYGDGKQTRSFQCGGSHAVDGRRTRRILFTMLELAEVVQETIDPNAKIEFRPNTEMIHTRGSLISPEPKSYLVGNPRYLSARVSFSDFRQRIFGDHKEGKGSNANNESSSKGLVFTPFETPNQI